MKNLLLLCVWLLSNSVFSATGWYQDYIKINVNGAGTTPPTGWYWIGGNPSYATQLAGHDFGVVSSMVIDGCDMKYWSDGKDRQGGAFYYKIMSADGNTQIVAPVETIWSQSYLGGNDYQGTINVSINLLIGLTANTTYQLHVWAKSWGSSQGDSWLNNSGANYVATFTTQQNTFSGTGDWTSAERWNFGVPSSSSNAIVAGLASVNSDVTINNLTINENYSVSINPTKSLTVNGTLTNNAGVTGLVIKSDASGTGSLKHSTPDVDATVERYLTDYENSNDQMYHFISSPVEAQAIRPEFVANTPLAGVDFYYFDELTNMWINSKAEGGGWNSGFDANFVVGKGYLVAYPDIVTKNFTGKLNTYPSGTPLVLTCTNTSGQGNGWNLLGNPFPSAIDWTTVSKGNGMDNALYYYDLANENYRYYILLDGDTQTSLGSGQQYIPAMQGFMVHAKSTGTKTVTINNDDRTHSGQTVFYKSSNTTPGSFSLKALGNGFEDEAFIHFSENATPSFDGDADAYKLRSYNELVPMIYTMGSDNSQLAINGMPVFELSTVIPVYFEAGVDGDYAIEANLENFNEADVYLEDKLLNQVQNLSDNPVYGFTALAGADADRFNVYFSPVGINDPSTSSQINIFTSDNNLLISGAAANAEIVVTNLLGQVVLQGKAGNSGLTVIGTGSLNDGIYVVSVVSGKQSVSKKISLR